MLGFLFVITYILIEMSLIWLLPGAYMIRILVCGFVFNLIAWFPAFSTYCALRTKQDAEEDSEE